LLLAGALRSALLAGALRSAGMVRSGATRPTWIMLDPLLRQAFNLRHFSPHELAFLQIVECSLLIQIKNRGATNRPDATLGAPSARPRTMGTEAGLQKSPTDIEPR
jgi:hypothetical protein